MGISYRLDEARGLSVSVWSGEIGLDERRRHMAALAADPGWGVGGLVLTDLRGVDEPSRPDADRLLDAASTFLAQLGDRARHARWAIVASTTFREAQRFGAYIEEEVPRVIVFNDLSTASTWLGVDPDDVRATVDGLRAELRSGEGQGSAVSA
jgi:hypothetical protein